MLKDDQDYSYNGGGDAKPQKTWSDFSTMQYMKFGGKRRRFSLPRCKGSALGLWTLPMLPLPVTKYE